MPPSGTVEFDVLGDGYRKALARWDDARCGRDPFAAFHALFEALAWTYSIDEKLGKPMHSELRGLRFVRNRVHHNWADAVALVEGAAFPRSYPMTFFEWEWRKVEELPPPPRPQPHDETFYRAHLESRPARLALDAVAGLVAGEVLPSS